MERLQPETHPDADQISVFLEGAAPEHERAQMLAHLAHCAPCREIVFLAHGAEAERQPAATPALPRPTRWWMPLGLAGAALACGAAALLVYMHQSAAPAASRQIAVVQPAAGPANESHATTSQARTQKQRPQPQVQSSIRLPGPRSAPAIGSGSGAGMGAGISQPVPPPSPAVIPSDKAEDMARANSARLPANTSLEAGVNTAPQQAFHGTVAQPAAPAPPNQGGPTAVLADRFAPLSLPRKPGLQILHDRGTSEGVGEVSGVVTDAIGAVIPRASVSLRSTSDNATRQVATGQDGRFTIADVPAGRYDLRVTAQGFTATSEPLELKSRDVAMLDSVLQVGAVSQTVSVEADNATMETPAQAPADALSLDAKLPAGAAAIAQVSMGKRMLSADAAGNLYLTRDAGKSWKKIKPKWQGKVAHIALVPAQDQAVSQTIEVTKPNPAQPSQLFELTTDTGAIWTSQDGKHWRPRN
jgi:hypothetical protein